MSWIPTARGKAAIPNAVDCANCFEYVWNFLIILMKQAYIRMLLQSYWIMNWFVSWGLIKHRMPLMLEGVGVWAYWLKHWPLSNQKISKEIATKSSPSIGWVGNFGVIGHFTSAGSVPIGARFSNSIMSSVNDPKHLRTGAEADLGRPVSLLFSGPASPCPGGHFTPSMMSSCFFAVFWGLRFRMSKLCVRTTSRDTMIRPCWTMTHAMSLQERVWAAEQQLQPGDHILVQWLG